MTRVMKLSDIRIKGSFKNSIPNDYKLAQCRECREARGRQIGKKSVKGRIFKSLGYYQCPTCGGLLMRNEKFCSECGQAILREGEE